MAHQSIKPRTYVMIYVLLLLLTATTVYIANNLHLGRGEIPVALGIAATKAVLVALFFMHLLYSSKLTWLALAIALLFLIAMIGITLSDYWTRGWIIPRRAVSQLVMWFCLGG